MNKMMESTVQVKLSLPRVKRLRGKYGHILVEPIRFLAKSFSNAGDVACHRGASENFPDPDYLWNNVTWADSDDPTCPRCESALGFMDGEILPT